MEYEKIRELMNDFSNSNLKSIQLDFPDGTKINMEKNDKEIDKSLQERLPKEEILDKNESIEEGNIVKSPMVGTFYIKPAPNAEPYVEVGKKVQKGEVLCIIEAMKLMNEIESEFTGEIKEIFVKDGDAVEYGEPLFRIK